MCTQSRSEAAAPLNWAMTTDDLLIASLIRCAPNREAHALALGEAHVAIQSRARRVGASGRVCSRHRGRERQLLESGQCHLH